MNDKMYDKIALGKIAICNQCECVVIARGAKWRKATPAEVKQLIGQTAPRIATCRLDK